MGNYLDTELLADMIRTRCGTKSLREIAKEIGSISPSTLSRVTNAKMPDIETFLLLCDWLQVRPIEFIKNTEDAGKSSVLDAKPLAIQLRTDKKLNPAIANALTDLIKALYDNVH